MAVRLLVKYITILSLFPFVLEQVGLCLTASVTLVLSSLRLFENTALIMWAITWAWMFTTPQIYPDQSHSSQAW